MPDDSRKPPPKEPSPPPAQSPETRPFFCFRCGSREIFYVHAKAVCAKCKQIVENCCGD